ncbi:hypothetical protein os1_02470 [Comamonadaceae bacterium OS-1]|nr:hypothetical protein os1_02470 [Comamonadaceae bacterium OS-1]
MTSFIAWVGVDQRGPSSLYFASDSRVTWDKKNPWDACKKVFACNSQPEVFGFVDYPLLPMNALTKAVAAIDAGLRPKQAELSAEGRCDWLWEQIKWEATKHPKNELKSFNIFYGLRTGSKHPIKLATSGEEQDADLARFHLFVLSWDHKEEVWYERTIQVPSKVSSVLHIDGSGFASIKDWTARWHESEQKDTSRVVFSAFCDSLASNSDESSGGAPQLVGTYWDKNAQTFGVHTQAHGATFQGSPYKGYEMGGVSWRNSLFERVNPLGTLLPKAQRHSRPKLGNPSIDRLDASRLVKLAHKGP